MVAENEVEIIAVRGRSSGGKRGLLHHCVVCDVTVRGSAEKPARLIRWSPINARVREIIAKWDRDIFRHSNLVDGRAGAAVTDQACGRQLCQGVEFRLASRAVSDAGVFMHVFE